MLVFLATLRNVFKLKLAKITPYTSGGLGKLKKMMDKTVLDT